MKRLTRSPPWPSISLAVVCIAAYGFGAYSAHSAEKVTLNVAGKILRCDVLKISKNDVTIKPEGQKEVALPLAMLLPGEVLACYKLGLEPTNAALRFDMGSYFVKQKFFDVAKIELAEAAKLDANFAGRAESLLKYIASIPEVAEPKKIDSKLVTSTDKPKNSDPSKMADGKSTGADYDSLSAAVESQTLLGRKIVPPRTDAQMKEFLDTRLAELNAQIGGTWRMVETKHYYCFSNIPEVKHRYIATQWNETLYDLLCRVLRHHDGDKLWNNKMPVYYFETFKQFQKFAVTIDKSPGAAYSGGYFAPNGREVHICVPFMSERVHGNTERADEMARNTICHEGTHAFLQLTGEDVKLNRWLHEGMAQFIEFLSDTNPASPSKAGAVERLKGSLAMHGGGPPPWEETINRPGNGTDHEGYALAYSKLEFFYRNFDHSYLPQMIRMLKSGKSEAEAIETVFKVKPDKLEEYYRKWVKEAAKANFVFPAGK